MTIHEQEAEEALGKWSSSKYAKLEDWVREDAVPDAARSCEVHSLMPFADRLWVATGWGGAGLYELDGGELMPRDEGVSGDNFGRMWHPEKDLAMLGKHVIDLDRNVQTVDITPVAWARHLDSPDTHAYAITYGGDVYEVDLDTLDETKVASTSDVASDIDHVNGAFTRFGYLFLADRTQYPADKGRLMKWDGTSWTSVEITPFTGVYSFTSVAANPLYAHGFDEFSAILMVTKDGDTWTKYRLPKSDPSYDSAGGQFGRIRPVEGYRMLADIHGVFYSLPYLLNANIDGATPGLVPRPICRHEMYPMDFCTYEGRMIIGKSESFPPEHHTGQPQSGLTFMLPDDLHRMGKPKGYGGVWRNTDISGEATPVNSDPMLINGFDRKTIHLETDGAATLTVQVDPIGDGSWKDYGEVSFSSAGYDKYNMTGDAIWCRIQSDTALTSITAWFNMR